MDIFTIKGIPGNAVLACQKILEVINQQVGSLEAREIVLKLAAPSFVTRDIVDPSKDVLAGITTATKATIQFNSDKEIRTAIDNVQNMLNDLSLLNKTEVDSDTKNEVPKDQHEAQPSAKSPAGSNQLPETPPGTGARSGTLKPKLLQYPRTKLLELRNSRKIAKDVTICINEVAKTHTRNATKDFRTNKQPETRASRRGEKTGTISTFMPQSWPSRVRPSESSLILKTTKDILNQLTSENLESLASAFSRYDLSQVSEEVRTSVMELVFCKAVEVPRHATLYAKWIHSVLEHFRNSDADMSVVKKLREAVVQVCKREFQKVIIAAGEKQEGQVGDSRARLRRNKFCLALFVGALYKLMAFSPRIMVDWIQVLVDVNNEEIDADSLDCLCKLLKSIGGTLEGQLRCSRMCLKMTGRNGQVLDIEMEGFFAHLKTFLKNILPLQTRIRLEELIDLYENNWQPRESPMLQVIKYSKEVLSSQNEVEVDKDAAKKVSMESTNLDKIVEYAISEAIPEVVSEEPEPESHPVDQNSYNCEITTSAVSVPEESKPQEAPWKSDMQFDCWDSSSSPSLTPSTPVGDFSSMWDWGSQPQSHQTHQFPASSPFSIVSPVNVWDTSEDETSRPSFFSDAQSPKGQLQQFQGSKLIRTPKTEFAQHQDLSNLLSDKEAALFIFRKYFESGNNYSFCEDLIIEKFDDFSKQRTLLDVVARRACETWSKAEQVGAGKFVHLMITSNRPELGYFTLDNLLWFLAKGGIMTEIKRNLSNNPRTALNLAFFVAEIVRDVPTFAEFIQLVDNSKVESCTYQFAEAIFQHIWDLFSECLLF